ncbi:MAG: ATPase [Bacteroidetes bacterium]|nr:MAG: ATPase [Bacteroidota bacterium]
MNDIAVIKASGEKVIFDQTKLIQSLERAGAGEDIINEVLSSLDGQLYDGIPTKKIYRQAYKILNKLSHRNAGRYRLKEAMLELGPSGYPFEHFIGELLRNQGYTTQVGVVVKGKCVSHEIDVIAENEHNHFMVECKYHSAPGKKSNVIVPLYIHSRFRDIIATMQNLPGYKTKLHQSWVVTNTRFTTDAIDYGKCSGMNLISWDYPADTNLRNRIDRSGLHPVTSLSSLKKAEKQKILSLDIVTCRNLLEHKSQLLDLGFSARRIEKISLEANRIIHNED